MKPNKKEYQIWFYSERSLDNLAQLLFEKRIIGEFEYDYENVYEWVEAQASTPSIEFNLSRKHSYLKDFKEGSKEQLQSNLKEPITLVLMYDHTEPSDYEIETIANQIHLVLAKKVYLGTIKYLGGDDYEYLKKKEII